MHTHPETGRKALYVAPAFFALNDYHGHRRLVERVTVDGDRPF